MTLRITTGEEQPEQATDFLHTLYLLNQQDNAELLRRNIPSAAHTIPTDTEEHTNA